MLCCQSVSESVLNSQFVNSGIHADESLYSTPLQSRANDKYLQSVIDIVRRFLWAEQGSLWLPIPRSCIYKIHCIQLLLKHAWYCKNPHHAFEQARLCCVFVTGVWTSLRPNVFFYRIGDLDLKSSLLAKGTLIGKGDLKRALRTNLIKQVHGVRTSL